MDVENPSEFLKEGKSRKNTPQNSAGDKSMADEVNLNHDAEDTRTVNSAVRRAAGKGQNGTVPRGRS